MKTSIGDDDEYHDLGKRVDRPPLKPSTNFETLNLF